MLTRLGNVDQKKTNIFHQSGENSGKTFTAVKGRFLQTFFSVRFDGCCFSFFPFVTR